MGTLRAAGAPATPDGNVACFNSDDLFDNAIPNGNSFTDDGYCAYRTAGGWRTEWVTQGYPPGKMGSNGSRVFFVSDDGSRQVFGSDNLFQPDYPGDSQSNPSYSSYMRFDGVTTWLTPRPPTLVADKPFAGSGAFPGVPMAVSSDWDEVLFESARSLVPDDTNEGAPDANGYLPATATDVYQWTPQGLRVVSTEPGAQSAWGSARVPKYLSTVIPGATAPDGSHVFFERRTGGTLDVYVKDGDDVSLVSPHRGPAGTVAGDVLFVGASADGDMVYLASGEQLTETPKVGPVGQLALYRYTRSTDQLDQIATVAGGVFPLAVSRDGSTVLYRANVGGEKLFAYRGGTATAIAPLDFSDTSAHRVAATSGDQRALRLSADGQSAVFVSAGGADPSALNVPQVYRWRAGVGVERLSVRSDGGPPTLPASIGSYTIPFAFPAMDRVELIDQHRNHPNIGRVWSDDAETVTFDTPEALVPEDRNEVWDVYQWHGGEVTLLSGGNPGGRDALYQDSSADGGTVFFHTYEPLLEADVDDSRDLYASRVGGGFPPPRQGSVGTPPPASAPSSPPSRRGTGLDEVATDDQLAPDVRRILTVGAPSRRARATASRTGRLRLAVRVSGGGRIVVRATARLRGKRRTVAKASKTVKRLGATRTLTTLRLSKAARRQLRRRSLRLRIAVTLRGALPEHTTVLVKPKRG